MDQKIVFVLQLVGIDQILSRRAPGRRVPAGFEAGTARKDRTVGDERSMPIYSIMDAWNGVRRDADE
jgi:hypothetical protein